MNYQPKIKKIYFELLRIGRVFWQRPYLILAILLLFDCLIFALFFWQYYLKPVQTEDSLSTDLTLNTALLDEFVLNWENRQAAFDSALIKEYPDMFTPSLLEQ